MPDDRIHLRNLRHATRCDGGRPAMSNGVYVTVREGFRPDQPGILVAQRAAYDALAWLNLLTIRSRVRP